MNEKNPFSVVYEDNHLIVVNKASGILVQGDETGDTPLVDLIKAYLKEKYHKPGNVFAGLVHRIDRPVSGLVIFAKTSKALERLNSSFRERQVEKTYWAVVKNEPQETSGVLIHWLTKDTKRNLAKAHNKEVKDSKKCELRYKVVGKTDNYYLLEVNPVTGRAHQIRCQLSAIHCPIRGDLKYGFQRSNDDAGINLHAYKVVLDHPVTKTKLHLKAALPDNNFWNLFKSFE